MPAVQHTFLRGAPTRQLRIRTSGVARLIPSDGRQFDAFGSSISTAADGGAIVVGAPVNVYEAPPYSGSAYVFVRPKKGWGVPALTTNETAKLTASDGWENNHFGNSVDMSADGKTIITGALEPPLLPGPIPGPGAAYVFARPFAGWSTSTENTKLLTPAEIVGGEWFGFSTALSGDGRVSLIGAPFETINANVRQGAAYVFTGTATDPIASASPTDLTFAPQSIGTTSSRKTVTLTNTGAGLLHVASVDVFGPFASTENCVSASPIAPGASCSESVAFAPLSVGDANGAVGFVDDSTGMPGATQFVQLAGTGKKGNTSTTITSVSSTRVLVGEPVTVSFSVAPESGSTLTPSGTVTVQASTGESCTAGVGSNGCTLTFSTAGNRTMAATYNGNSTFNASTSSSVTVRVTRPR